MNAIFRSVYYVASVLLFLMVGTVCIYITTWSIVKTVRLIDPPNAQPALLILEKRVNILEDEHNNLLEDLTRGGYLPIAK